MNLFELAPPRVAPVLRIVLCAYLAVTRAHAEAKVFARDKDKSLDLVHAPLFDALDVPLPIFDALPVLLVVFSITALLGIATRVSLLGLFLVWLPMGTLESGYGYFNHAPALAAQVALALAFAPGASAWSLDRLIVAKWRRAPVEWAPLAPRFGDVVILLAIGVVYCASGVAKLRWGGLSWLDGSTLAFYLQKQQVPMWFGAELGAPLSTQLAQPQTWKDGFGDIMGYTYLTSGRGAFLDVGPLPALLSWFTIIVEVGAPFALLAGWRVRAAWCLCSAGFHISIFALVGPGFAPWLAVLAGVFPWMELRDFVRARFDRARQRGGPALKR